jgi:hypothetical protein
VADPSAHQRDSQTAAETAETLAKGESVKISTVVIAALVFTGCEGPNRNYPTFLNSDLRVEARIRLYGNTSGSSGCLVLIPLTDGGAVTYRLTAKEYCEALAKSTIPVQ